MVQKVKQQAKKEKAPKETVVLIKAPNMKTIDISIVGVSPLCVHAFGAKAKQQMRDNQESVKGKSTKKKEPKNFDAYYQDARHISDQGWDGMAASAFRNASISACRVAGYVMTKAKLSIFIEPDGLDREDATPLVRILGPKPENWVAAVRLSTGVIDLHPRPLWRKWGMVVRVRFDADQFGEQDIVNLFATVGLQVGIGEGRPDSKASAGIGFGLFKIVNKIRKEDIS